MVSFVIVCAGSSTRMQSAENKNLLLLDDKPLFMHSAQKFLKYSDDVIVVCKEEEKELFDKYYHNLVIGGSNRLESVYNGIKKAQHDICFIHDGARPNISYEDIDKLFDNIDSLPLFLGSYVDNSIKKDLKNICRDNLVLAYTPQVVLKEDYLKAYELKTKDYTDDVDLIYDVLGKKPKMILGKKDNYKITTKEDYLELLKNNAKTKIGYSWDIHQLVLGRKLILGGLDIPFEKGLLGHSDGDVLLHAIAESLLGALALGDLGKFYPDNDEKTLGISSKIILEDAYRRISELGYGILNIDTMVFAERPKLAEYILPIRQNIANILGIDLSCVSVKATTHERLGLVGEGKAIASSCSVLLYKK